MFGFKPKPKFRARALDVSAIGGGWSSKMESIGISCLCPFVVFFAMWLSFKLQHVCLLSRDKIVSPFFVVFCFEYGATVQASARVPASW